MLTLKFRNQNEMPALGLGTWKSQPGEVYDAVKTAIKTGYRHIDCAAIYGNEKEIGQAITECISDGVVSRNDLWITSKLWNSEHAKDDVLPALEKTLSDLQLTYLDLYLIHWPVNIQKGVVFPQSAGDMVSLDDIPISETWAAMEEAIDHGLAKHIGVSNFGIKQLENLLTFALIKPEINQVESHPYFQQNELLAFCRSNNIHLTAYSPLGSFDRPDGIKASDEPKLLDDPIIAEIASIHHVSPAQILISWALHRGISVIPKSVNSSRISQNLAAASIRLSAEDIERINQMDKEYRYITGGFWVFEGGPYSMESVWA